MTDNYSLTGSYTLPSLGKVYKMQINPNVTLRSMTTEEEMRRLNPSDRPYKVMADIIDACIVDDIGISAYDMCISDYQFLLHKLRVVTYGDTYSLSSTCPWCGTVNTGKINLSQMEVFEYSDDIQKYFEFDLPRTKHHIRIKMQTPRMLDDISIRAKETRKKSPTMTGDPAFLFNVESIIDTVDGVELDVIKKSDFVRKLPMMDTNYIVSYAQKLTESVGLNTVLENTCDVCGLDFKSTFRTTSEFFRPEIDI